MKRFEILNRSTVTGVGIGHLFENLQGTRKGMREPVTGCRGSDKPAFS